MKRQQPERAIHLALVGYIRRFGVPGVYWKHIPNGGKRSIQWASKLKALGEQPGVPDLEFFHRGRFFALELKAPGGRQSPAQIDVQDLIEANDGFYAIAHSLEKAVDFLKSWGLVR